MRSLLIFPFLFFVLLFSSFSNKGSEVNRIFLDSPKTIGIYDEDSILAVMPSYRAALDSADDYKRMLDVQLQTMTNELTLKKNVMKKDSLTMTPLDKEIKQKEISDLTDNIQAFNEVANEDFIARKNQLIQPCTDKIKMVASKLAKKKRLFAVTSKKELSGYLVMYPNSKLVNLTAEISKQPEIKN